MSSVDDSTVHSRSSSIYSGTVPHTLNNNNNNNSNNNNNNVRNREQRSASSLITPYSLPPTPQATNTSHHLDNSNSALIQQKDAQIARLESLLQQQTDASLSQLSRTRSKSDANLERKEKKWKEREEKLEGKWRRKLKKAEEKWKSESKEIRLRESGHLKTIADLENNIRRLSSERTEDSNYNSYAADAERSRFEDRISALQKELDDSRRLLSDERTRNAELSRDITVKSDRVLDLQRNVNDLSGETTRLSSLVEGERTTSERLKREVTRLEGEVREREDKADKLRREVERIETDRHRALIESANEQKTRENQREEEFKKELDLAKTSALETKTKLEDKINDLEKRGGEENGALADANATISSLKAELQKIKTDSEDKIAGSEKSADEWKGKFGALSLHMASKHFNDRQQRKAFGLLTKNSSEKEVVGDSEDGDVVKAALEAEVKRLAGELERSTKASSHIADGGLSEGSEEDIATTLGKEGEKAASHSEQLKQTSIGGESDDDNDNDNDDDDYDDYADEFEDDDNDDKKEKTASPPKSTTPPPSKSTPSPSKSTPTLLLSDKPNRIEIEIENEHAQTTPAIASTVLQLRSTLSAQQHEVDDLKKMVAILTQEKNVAIEMAGISKLEAMESTAKLEVSETVRRMDDEISRTGTARETVRSLEEGHTLSDVANEHLNATSNFLMKESARQLPASHDALNDKVLEGVKEKASEIAGRLYGVYDDVSSKASGNQAKAAHATTDAVEFAKEISTVSSPTNDPRPRSRSPEASILEPLKRSVHFSTPPETIEEMKVGDLEYRFTVDGDSEVSPDAKRAQDMMDEMGTAAPFAGRNNIYDNSAFPEYSELGEKNSTFPRLMKGLRTRVANELYQVGELLFTTVDSDFRESIRGGRTRNSNPITDIERWQFRKNLQKSAHGTLRWLLLIYLRTYDSLEDMMKEKKEVEVNTRSAGQFHVSPNRAQSDSFRRSASSIVPDNNPYSTQTPETVLRERMHGLLEDVKDAWEIERRDLNKVGQGSLLHEEERRRQTHKPVVKRPFHRTERRRKNHACFSGCQICSSHRTIGDSRDVENERRTKLNFLDSGAGPREFWGTVSPSITQREANGESVTEEEVEQHLWRLVLLVRCQDRDRGLRLQRHESQRKLLDLRVYELVLLYMRITFMKEKVIEIDVVNGGEGELKLKFMDVGKWSGHNFNSNSTGPINAFSRSKASSNSTLDAANFARITEEFEKIKKDRFARSSSVNGIEANSKSGRAVAHGRAKMREGPGGKVVNPMGHSYALGAVSKKQGGFEFQSKIGNGMLDSLYGDRRDFF